MGRVVDGGIDYDLWRRATAVFGRIRAVVLMTCPRCGEESLIWSGMTGAGCRCLNHKCGLRYKDFEELVNGHEAYVAAKRIEEIKDLMSHDSFRRIRGRIRQVRHT